MREEHRVRSGDRVGETQQRTNKDSVEKEEPWSKSREAGQGTPRVGIVSGAHKVKTDERERETRDSVERGFLRDRGVARDSRIRQEDERQRELGETQCEG